MEREVPSDFFRGVEEEIDAPEKQKTSQIWKQILEIMRKNSIVFNDITKLNDNEIQLLIRSVDFQPLKLAMHNSPQEVQNRIFRNLSERKSEILKSELEEMNDVPEEKIEESREKFVESIIYFSDMGKINLDEDEFIVKPDLKTDWKIVGMPEKNREEFWYAFTKTGIPSELREKLILNGKEFFKNPENQALFEKKFNEILGFAKLALEQGILSLEVEIENADDFTATALELLCDATEMPVMDEILSSKILQDNDINSQFLKYLTMRGIMYIQCGLDDYKIAKNLIFLIPDEYKDFAEKLSRR